MCALISWLFHLHLFIASAFDRFPFHNGDNWESQTYYSAPLSSWSLWHCFWLQDLRLMQVALPVFPTVMMICNKQRLSITLGYHLAPASTVRMSYILLLAKQVKPYITQHVHYFQFCVSPPPVNQMFYKVHSKDLVCSWFKEVVEYSVSNTFF